jgi:hypothetical protein
MLIHSRLFTRTRRTLTNQRVRFESRLAIWSAGRVKRRALNQPNPGYDELRHPLFIGVMVLGILALVVDMADAWQPLGAFILALGEWARSGA